MIVNFTKMSSATLSDEGLCMMDLEGTLVKTFQFQREAGFQK